MAKFHSYCRWIITIVMLFCVSFSSVAANWLCFTAEEDGSKVGYLNYGGNAPDVQYSTDDGVSWNALAPGTYVALQQGEKVYFRGDNPDGFSHEVPTTDQNFKHTSFSLTGRIAASGSVMSLIDGKGNTLTIPSVGCFARLFSLCESLTTAPEMPAMVLTEHCYDAAFLSCSSLTQAPVLPAEELAPHCYMNMFAYCTQLQKAPELPAKTMVQGCYTYMFANSGLKEAPELLALNLDTNCYEMMFAGCKDLVTPPDLYASVMAKGCYKNMFKGCVSLVQAPTMYGSQLAEECFMGMYSDCSNLNYIKVCLFTLDNEVNAMDSWVSGVDGPGYFILPCGSSYDKHGDSEVPDNFDIITSPILIFQNPDGTEIWRDTAICLTTPEYNGPEPYFGDSLIFKKWDPIITTVGTIPDVYYYTAQYDKRDEPDDPAPGNWLCFKSKRVGSQVVYVNNGGNSPDVQYSLDEGATWTVLEPYTPIVLDEGERIFFRGNNPDGFSHWDEDVRMNPYGGRYTNFVLSGELSASGSVMSLIDGEGTSTTIPCVGCFAHLFRGSLLKAPELPATTLKPKCYFKMFSVSDMRVAPELPATELEDYCYAEMFSGCHEIVEVPALKATVMKPYCYYNMFNSCSGITHVAELPATILADHCYSGMFSGTRLVEGPVLPVTDLAPYCYERMFQRCSYLTQASALPATQLAEGCYSAMFYGCENLAFAPELPADSLVANCYSYMFNSCMNLEYVKVGVFSLDNDVDATTDWVYEIQHDGLFIFPCGSRYDKHGFSEVPMNFRIAASPVIVFQNPDSTVLSCDTIDCGATPAYHGETPSAGPGTIFTEWDKPFEPLSIPDVYYFTAQYENMGDAASPNCLRLTAGSGGASFMIAHTGGNDPNIEFSTNGGVTWSSLSAGDIVRLSEGDVACIRGVNPDGFSKREDAYTQFLTTGSIAASGSVMSLIDGDGSSTTIPNDYCFTNLFKSTSITSAPSLPAVSLRNSCYSHMFEECDNLQKAPALPAETLAVSCYEYMFAGCALIDSVPLLPAIKLKESCYANMFTDCSNLKFIKLPALVLADSCYAGMFAGCVSVLDPPNLPAHNLTRYCYASMFKGCSFYYAPEMEAITAAEYCCTSMFENCTKLSRTAKANVYAIEEGCFEYMYRGCTNLAEADISEAELKKNCYHGMFSGCESMNYIRVGIMTLDNDLDATLDWVDGVDGKGLFVFPCGSRYDKHGYSEVPPNFEIQSSPIIIFQNPDGTELWRDTTDCEHVPEYKGPTPTYGEGLAFKGWDKRLEIPYDARVYYYTAEYGQAEDVPAGKWLCFTAEEAGSEFWYVNSEDNVVDLQYSFDGKQWNSLDERVKVPLEKVGDKVYLRGNNPSGFSHGSSPKTSYFGMSGRIAASGNVMSLVDEECKLTKIPYVHCFDSLFAGCEALTKAPELPATEMTDYCYSNMFSHCTNLTEMPELRSSELAKGCYASMFAGCEKLTKTTELFSSILKEYCYARMFQGCTALTQAPTLHGTIIDDGCYYGMFQGCVSLTEAPVLYCSHLSKECYAYMFDGCTSLSYIEVGVLSLDNDFDATLNWVNGIDGGGLFVFPCGSKYNRHGISEVPANFAIKSSPILIFLNADSTELWRDTTDCFSIPVYKGETPTFGDDLVFIGWDKTLSAHTVPDVYYYVAQYFDPNDTTPGNWLCFTAEEAGSQVGYASSGNTYPDVQYSIDEGKTWTQLMPRERVTLENVGDKVYLRGFNPHGFNYADGWNSEAITSFFMSGQVAASGSVMSLVDGLGVSESIPCEKCFSNLFSGCDALTKAPELPATSLMNSCYSYMFVDCSNLTEAPQLPATELKESCYQGMFQICTGLKVPPVLPALKLAPNCYAMMFFGCSALEKTPELPATELDNQCYYGMFNECVALTEMPDLPATHLAPSCYSYMFLRCKSLTKAKRLPATDLADYCYSGMFGVCTNLAEAPELPAMDLAVACYEHMFISCHALTRAPELPATTLRYRCYQNMFEDCVNLNYIKVGVMSLDNDSLATEDWVSRVDGEGLFIFPCGSKYNKHGDSEVPLNFTIQSSPIVVFLNPDSTVLQRDTIGCNDIPEYRGETPTFGENLVFKGWDNELTVLPIPEVYYFTAMYEEKNSSVTNVPLSACDSFVYEGVTYRESRSWNDTLPAFSGDDSIVAYHLTIHKSVVTEEKITAEGSYTWKGITFTEDTSWNDTLQTRFGCDSIVQYRLEIKDVTTIPALTDIPLIACDSLVFEGVTYRESREWNDTLPAANGGDSILAYHLTIHKSVTTEENISAMDSYTWKEITYTESTSWSDTLQTVYGCDSIVRVNLVIKTVAPPPITVDKILSACDSFVYNGTTYRENSSWNERLKNADGGDSIVSYRLIIHRGVTVDSSIIAEGSYTWKGTTYTEDASWNDTLQTIHGCDSIVRYRLTFAEERSDLQLTVDDELYLVLPGASETISYELTGGVGSKYEVRQDGKVISSGDVTNDSTVSLNCPSNLEPGVYEATLEMCDDEGNCAEKDFTFNVMRPDDKQKSFYVKVWNDVVICRNGDGVFQTFQWYKNGKKCEKDTLQYFNDVALLDGDYMVFVKETSDKSYFIEPIHYDAVEAAYTITAEPNVVAKGTEFTLKVSGVEPDELANARIVAFHANGVVEMVLEDVEAEQTMCLKSGEYVIVLTLRDGKNANCKVLIR